MYISKINDLICLDLMIVIKIKIQLIIYNQTDAKPFRFQRLERTLHHREVGVSDSGLVPWLWTLSVFVHQIIGCPLYQRECRIPVRQMNPKSRSCRVIGNNGLNILVMQHRYF
jgi:hypothetical protein